MDLLEKFKKISKKQKAYIATFVAIIGLLAWAFISAGVITHNFNRSQLQTDQNRQEALIKGIILTETKDEKKYWEIYGESGNYDSKNGNWDVNNRKSPICDKKSHPRILGISSKWCNSLGTL